MITIFPLEPNILPFREKVECDTYFFSKGGEGVGPNDLKKLIRYNFARIRPRVIKPRYSFCYFPEDLETVLASL